jgi:hypothetical protein
MGRSFNKSNDRQVKKDSTPKNKDPGSWLLESFLQNFRKLLKQYPRYN